MIADYSYQNLLHRSPCDDGSVVQVDVTNTTSGIMGHAPEAWSARRGDGVLKRRP